MTHDENQEVERKLLEKALHGDKSAFGELARRHYPGVVSLVYRLCGDTALAEDMAQETFLRAWLNLRSFQPTASLRNWLYRIAVNATLDVLRRRKDIVQDIDKFQTVAGLTPDPETVLLAEEQARQIQQAIHSLPSAARAVLVLREYGELSYREIAEALDIPIGTVMSRLSYARDRLRRLLVEGRQENNHA